MNNRATKHDHSKSTNQSKPKGKGKTKMTKAKNDNKPLLLTKMELATRLGISVYSLDAWRNYEGFPKNSRVLDGHKAMMNVEAIEAWLRQRSIHSLNRPPKWARIVGHPAILAHDAQEEKAEGSVA